MHVPPSRRTHARHPGQVKSRRKKAKPSTSVYRFGHLSGLVLKKRKTEPPPRVASPQGFPSRAASFTCLNQPRYGVPLAASFKCQRRGRTLLPTISTTTLHHQTKTKENQVDASTTSDHQTRPEFLRVNRSWMYSYYPFSYDYVQHYPDRRLRSSDGNSRCYLFNFFNTYYSSENNYSAL